MDKKDRLKEFIGYADVGDSASLENYIMGSFQDIVSSNETIRLQEIYDQRKKAALSMNAIKASTYQKDFSPTINKDIVNVLDYRT